MQENDLPLPPGVREKHGSWHYVENHRWSKLCRITEGRSRLYERLQEVTGGVAGMCWHAILSYIAKGMDGLAEATKRNYRQAAWRMLHHFGHWRIEDVQPTHCAQFLKWCRDHTSALTGNRDKAFMSSVWEFSMGEGWASFNPWRGVKRNKERPSKRYVEHETLVSTLDRAPPELQNLMAVAYLTGIRQTDLRFLKWTQVESDSLMVVESKTGKSNEHEITKTVRQFLDGAVTHTNSVIARHEQRGRAARAAAVRAQPFVFLTQRGLPWSEWGLQSALRRFKAGFRFRDLRPKAQTDRPDRDILGHTGQMRERYHKRRKLSAVK